MVASATIHELLLFIFESVKLKKLNFWSIFMQWLKHATVDEIFTYLQEINTKKFSE
jgi:hypothetical protein